MMAESAAATAEDAWEKITYYKEYAKNVLLVWLVGLCSHRQLEYEEMVLQQIVHETGGEDIPEDDPLYQDHP